TTLLLAGQYVPLVVVPAYLNHSQASSFISALVATGVGTALLIELAIAPLDTASGLNRAIGLPSAILIAVGGFIALIGATLLGTGTYAAQIGSEAASPLASLFTPFQSWTVAGFGLLFGCWARGGVRR